MKNLEENLKAATPKIRACSMLFNLFSVIDGVPDEWFAGKSNRMEMKKWIVIAKDICSTRMK